MKYLYFLFFIQCAFAINSFEEFKEFYNKKYSSFEEEQYRQNVFYNNLQRIVYHNSINKDFKLKMNNFGDLYSDEYYTSVKLDRKFHSSYEFSNSDIPTSIDWVKRGVVSPVKNQGQCGSCYAFSTTGALEGLYGILYNKSISFSEQQIMDCSVKEGDNGCDGGLMDYGFQYVIDAKGICKEEEYPYKEQNGTCHICDKVFNITGFVDVSQNNETALMYAVAQQPVSVAIQADSFEFQFYSHGVFTGYCGNAPFDLDHGVLAVGYGSEDGKDYWLAKNSWGTWGNAGYIKLERNVNYKEGKCGIAMQPSYPIKKEVIILKK